ncbi:hypothetical protein M9Y10_041284 [Tritrichomonas musculus]|uniref:Saposin B-type domain-containing protein n=1 Tax=Tritrichomonas musculus TaxID=1915356 RepID=A0ABR2K702_9EUKA
MFFALLGLALCSPINAKQAPKLRKHLSVGDSSQKCVFCKFYVSMIEDYLKDGQTQEEIAEAVSLLCDYCSETVKPYCVNLIDAFLPTIISYIEQGIEHAQVCQLIKLCKD